MKKWLMLVIIAACFYGWHELYYLKKSVVPFEVVTIEEVPAETKEVIEKIKRKRGYALNMTKEGDAYLILLEGLKTTEGYKIDVLSVTKKEDGLKVKIKEKRPIDPSIHRNNVNYPMTIIRLPAAKYANLPVQVVSKGEKEMYEITEEYTNILSATGTLMGYINEEEVQINVTEDEMEFQALNFRLTGESRKLLTDVKLKQKIHFTYQSNDQYQLTLLDLEAARNYIMAIGTLKTGVAEGKVIIELPGPLTHGGVEFQVPEELVQQASAISVESKVAVLYSVDFMGRKEIRQIQLY